MANEAEQGACESCGGKGWKFLSLRRDPANAGDAGERAELLRPRTACLDCGGTGKTDPLTALQRDFPAFEIWREITHTGVRYIARSKLLSQSPHTLVTKDPAELRAALAAATIPAQPTRST